MADSRTLIDRARVECANHWFVYDEQMTVESCAQAVSNLAIQFGDSDDDGSAMVCVCLFLSRVGNTKIWNRCVNYVSESTIWSCNIICWL